MKTILRYRASCMMVLAAIFFISFPPAKLFSQQLEIRRSRGTGSFMTFSEWKGWSVAWNQKMKSGAKYGISFDYARKTDSYSWVRAAFDYETNTEKIYVENRYPDNHRYSATLFWGWCPLKSDKAAIYCGPTMSINWLIIKELTHRYANEWFEDAIYYNVGAKKNKIGFGVFLEFEIRKIIFERLSASMRLHTEANGYNGLGSWDRSAPQMISWFGTDFGLKWDFGKRKPISMEKTSL